MGFVGGVGGGESLNFFIFMENSEKMLAKLIDNRCWRQV